MAITKDRYTIDPYGYDIKSLVIVGENAEIDIRYLMVELNIDEDIFGGPIAGSLIVIDSLNLISNLPVMEGDLIKGKFIRPANDPYVYDFDPTDLEFSFEIIKITAQEKTKQDKQMFALSFVSSTWTDHLSRRLSKSFHQMPYSDMIKNIYTTYLTGGGLNGQLPIKELVTSPSDGLWNIIIPNLKPYDAILFLQKRALAEDASSFLFWEDREQFNFRPFSELFAAEAVAEYFTPAADEFSDKNNEPDQEKLAAQYLNAGDFKRKDYHDLNAAAMTGMLSNRLIRHDIFNKRVVDHKAGGDTAGNYTNGDVYNYQEEFDKLKHTDENSAALIRSNTNTKMALGEADTIMNVYPDHNWQFENQESYKSETWLRQRKGQMAQLNFVRFQLVTPGNMTRKVGDKIKINSNSPEWKLKGADEKPKKDSRFSGNYIITSIKRKFTTDNFSCVMEIIRDDYVSLVTDPIWEEAAPADFGSRISSRGGMGGV